VFASGEYFAAKGMPSFHPEVPVVFEVVDPAQKYHVPLLLCPFSYTTYRGY
jgi:5-hydroxyisourate hydrolase